MKEILGFKYNKQELDDDHICPNCGYELNLPVGMVTTNWFHTEHWDKYTCSKCNLEWKVTKK